MPLPSVTTSDSAIWSLTQSASLPSPALVDAQYLEISTWQLPAVRNLNVAGSHKWYSVCRRLAHKIHLSLAGAHNRHVEGDSHNPRKLRAWYRPGSYFSDDSTACKQAMGG